MQFEPNVYDYLRGRKFSKGLHIHLPKNKEIMLSKMELVESIVSDKKIIHLGCTDHKELIKGKIERGEWFHKRLLDASSQCLGIDINKEAINYCRNELGYDDIYCHDVLNDEPLQIIINNRWDYMVLGDILEHIDNPHMFLRAIRTKYSNYIRKIVITVPNAFSYENLRGVLKHHEVINSDHRYWFTSYTLAKVVVCSGMEPATIWYVSNIKTEQRTIRKLLKRLLFKNYPMFRESLVMVAHLNKSDDAFLETAISPKK